MPARAGVFRAKCVSSYCMVTLWLRSICENGNHAETVPCSTRSVYPGPEAEGICTSRSADTEMSG